MNHPTIKPSNHKTTALRGDITGAFGDIGTLLPLAIGLVIICGVNPVPLFGIIGLAYIISGLYYRVPIPVQPLKAMAAISIISGLSPDMISTAAILMAGFLILIGITGAARLLPKLFSKPIIRGIQLGVGFMLMKSALSLILNGEILQGVSLSTLDPQPSTLNNSTSIIKAAFFLLVIPQIPLTLGNALVATTDLAREYFGKRAGKVTCSRLAIGLGLGNLAAGLLGGMPFCHGSGGLTAHYKFGARTHRSNLIIGTVYLSFGILLMGIPIPSFLYSRASLTILGTLLFYIGIHHAILIRDLKDTKDIGLTIIMGFLALYYGGLTTAFFTGLLLGNISRLWGFSRIMRAFSTNESPPECRDERWEMGDGRHEKVIGNRLSVIGKNGNREIVNYQPSTLSPQLSTIRYLRLSVTDKCNLDCVYCKGNHRHSNGKSRIMNGDEIVKAVGLFLKMGIDKIRITGGEPLLREDLLTIINKLSSMEGISDLPISTNGILLKQFASGLKDAGINRVNISLDTLRTDRFSIMTRGGNLKDIISGIDEAVKAGFNPIKINVVVMRGINDDELSSFIDFRREYGLTVRFIELMPFKLHDFWRRHFVSREEIIERIKERLDPGIIPFGRRGEPAKYYQLKGGGEVGIISPISHGFCSECNRLRLTSDGYLRVCLMDDREYDILSIIQRDVGPEEISRIINEAVLSKPYQRDFFLDPSSGREFYEIGG